MLYGVSPPMLAEEDVTFPDFYTRYVVTVSHMYTRTHVYIYLDYIMRLQTYKHAKTLERVINQTKFTETAIYAIM